MQQREGGPRESGGSPPASALPPGPSCQSRQQPVDLGAAVRLLWAPAGPGRPICRGLEVGHRFLNRVQGSTLGWGVGDGASERQKEPHCASSRVLPHTLPVGSWGREALDLLGSSMGSQQGKLPLSPAEGRADLLAQAPTPGSSAICPSGCTSPGLLLRTLFAASRGHLQGHLTALGSGGLGWTPGSLRALTLRH